MLEIARKEKKSEIERFIKAKGGSVSPDWIYINNRTYFPVKCEREHTFQARWANLQNDHWCPFCTKQKVLEEDVRKFITNKGWTLSSNWKYVNSSTQFPVTCEKKHTWYTTWNGVHDNHGCPECVNHIVYEEDVRKFIENKGGILETDWKYVNNRERFLVTCELGHRFETCWHQLKSCWCSYCHRKFVQERALRLCLENLLHTKFPSTRPQWLRYTSGRLLELDGYNEGLSTAFEYQGLQHYELCYVNRFSKEILEETQRKDAFKIKTCQDKGVKLIVMPYWIPKKNWETEIKNQIANYK
jgi:hypothetical protein